MPTDAAHEAIQIIEPTETTETPAWEPTRGANPAVGNPLISIIVPALNEEKLLERTLRCFPPQLRERYGMELIVSDGGSSDATPLIAEQYADAVARHTEPRRQTIAEGRNRGAERARGVLLVFINADTVPKDAQKFLAALQQIAQEDSPNGSRVVAYACPVEIAPEERQLSDRLFHGFFNRYVRFLNAIGVGMGRGECQVIHRAPFLKAGGYDNGMVAGEDFDLYKRLTRLGTIGHRAELMVHESPRRFRRYGYLRVLWEWTLNALSVIFSGKAVSKEWEQIR
ncbi:MAG: glycosyltransferase [Armatimonadetes bacterium]|nr:glycosyltransferase [Armatimonadota bacterium]